MITPNTDHPARFSRPILAAMQGYIGAVAAAGPYLTGPVRALDPFAGEGNIHRLSTPGDRFYVPGVETVGVELEPEWAVVQPGTVVGDATRLPFADQSFDVMATSPCYGNRMADDHDAKDLCKSCGGSGCAVPTCEGGLEAHLAHMAELPVPLADHTPCDLCKGSGLSRRNTYRHRLGRPLSKGSASNLHFTKPAYKRLHTKAWAEAHRVLRPYGLAIVNVSNFENDGTLHRVVEWHLQDLVAVQGFRLEAIEPVVTRRNKQGANRDVRADHEMVLVLRKVA